MSNITAARESQSVVKSDGPIARVLNAAAKLEFIVEDLDWALDAIDHDGVARNIRDAIDDMRVTLERTRDDAADLVAQADLML